MPLRLFPRRSGLIAAALLAAAALAVAPLQAQAPPAPSPIPLSATSQCVEGPGAPPADPSKVTRVTPGAPVAPVEEPPIDAPPTPGAPAPVLLELGASTGASARLDDGTWGITTQRAGLVLGGSMFVWTSRSLALGASYTHADLSRSATSADSSTPVETTYDVHALMLEARVVPLRFSTIAVLTTLGLGTAWQHASLRATLPPVNGDPGGSFHCSAGSNAELSLRGGLGIKARLGRASALIADFTFTGYRLSGGVLDACTFGAGTAQTLMLRAGVAYDLDISRLVR